MARISDSFLADVKARVKPSAVVGRYYKLVRRGGGEFVVADDESFTISDKRELIHDFGSGSGFTSGDIFEFVQWKTGCTFTAAVEECASIAGLQLPDRQPTGARSNSDSRSQSNGEARAGGHDRAGGRSSERDRRILEGAYSEQKIIAVYDYRDQDGALIYQVVRKEWTDERGRHKITVPRRPIPNEPGRWTWGLKGGAYVRARDGDFHQLTDKREAWTGERRAFEEIAPLLYHYPELREEMAQDADERRIVFVPEGEKDTDTLVAWGCCATTCMGGTNGWRPWFASYFAGADIVIPMDNDPEGRKFAHEKALALRGFAKRIRLLDFRTCWPACPDKGDITDWRDVGGGTVDRLFEIVDKLPDWRPEPPESAFNAVRWADLDKPARELSWLVKKVVTRGEVSIWFGAPGSGKSFIITDMALAIARGGLTWFGCRTHPGLVIYQAGEGGLGLKKRLRAYRRHHGIAADAHLPFVLLPSRINLWVDDKHTDELIKEIAAWSAYYDQPLELIVVDTMSAAATGANENASEDVGRVLQRCHRIAVSTGAHVALVHHTPKAGGSPRGWSGLTGNVESAIEVLESTETHAGATEGGHAVHRTVRQFVTRKQKDAESALTWSFVLKLVTLGTDADGDPDTSCVVESVGPAAAPKVRTIPAGWSELRGNNILLMRALVSALDSPAAVVSPPAARAPASTKCVRVSDWQAALYQLAFVDSVNDPEGKRGKDRARKAVDRAFTQEFDWVAKRGLIGKRGDWIWRSGRLVVDIDPMPTERHEPAQPARLYAEGETDDDLPF